MCKLSYCLHVYQMKRHICHIYRRTLRLGYSSLSLIYFKGAHTILSRTPFNCLDIFKVSYLDHSAEYRRDICNLFAKPVNPQEVSYTEFSKSHFQMFCSFLIHNADLLLAFEGLDLLQDY